MKPLPAEAIFSAPKWMKIICYILGSALILLGFSLLLAVHLPNEIIFVVPLIFLIAVSMFIYTRLKLIITNTGIRFIGGIKQHCFAWTDITKVDMQRFGKYKTPVATIYYAGNKLRLNKGFYLQPGFNHILLLLETKIASSLFTDQYQHIRMQE